MFSYDVRCLSNKDKVRFLIQDTQEEDAWFHDEEVGLLLSFETDDVFRASALALERQAARLAQTPSVVLGSIRVDGASAAKELRARAQELRDLALGATSTEVTSDIDWAEMAHTDFGARQRLENEIARQYQW